jgi:tetratricopeptide (TPR) repeat protein
VAKFALGPHALTRYYNRQIAGWMVFFKRESAALARYADSVALYDGDHAAKQSLANLFAQPQASYYAPDKALALFEQLARQQPKAASHLFNAAFVQQSLGAHAQALTLFTQALEIEPHLDRAWYGLGLSQLALGQLDGAIASFTRNTELQPMSPYGWYQLAISQAHAGQWAQARETGKHLQTFEPRFARGLVIDLNAIKSPAEAAHV